MYERIVVPLDGSPYAERALPWARVIAARSDAKLRLVHVHVPLRIPTSQAVLGPRIGEELKRMGTEHQDRKVEYLRKTGDRLVSDSDGEVTTELLKGPTAASLARDAELASAELIVMAPRDLRPLERLGGGSVTEQLVRCCPIPVLAVRGGNGYALDALPVCRQILVPLDGTERVEAAAEQATVMAGLFDASILLLRVVRPSRRAGTGAAAAYLERVADRIHRNGIAVETRVVRHRDAAGAIKDVASETGAGMIVMSSRYRDGLPRVVRERPAEAVLRGAPAPVLLVGAHDADGGRA